MMTPSMITIVLGFVITAVLGLVDWYVWRTTPAMPYPMAPTGPHFTETEEAAFKKVA